MPEFHFFLNLALGHIFKHWQYKYFLYVIWNGGPYSRIEGDYYFHAPASFISYIWVIICTAMQSNRKCFFRKWFHPIVCWVSSDHRNYEITSKSALCREINILPLGAASKNQWWKVFILRKPGPIVHKFSAKKLSMYLYVLDKLFPALIYEIKRNLFPSN